MLADLQRALAASLGAGNGKPEAVAACRNLARSAIARLTQLCPEMKQP